MVSLMKRDYFKEFLPDLPDLFGEFFSSPGTMFESEDFYYSDGDKGVDPVLKIDVPGCRADDVHVEVDGDTLIVNASRGGRIKKASTRLRPTIDVDKISATIGDGVLEITLPRKAVGPSGARQITVKPR